jgi:nucleotide-binding universal stress UspA family protein
MIPPRSVLAAVDFSDSSRVALGFAVRLAQHSGAALHVLHAQDPLLSAAAKASGIDLSEETREELTRFVRSSAPHGMPIRYHVVSGAGTGAICHVATRERSDVIVVGMHGMSGPARAVFGSTTEGVLRQADSSVMVVPDVWTPARNNAADLSGIGPVVAAIEFTEPSIASAAAACRLAAMLHTSVELLHIVSELPAIERWRAHADAATRRKMEEARRELGTVVPVLEASVPIDLRVEAGRVAEGIAAALATNGERQPILVLGRRPHKDRLGAPGATAYRVLTHTSVPVLVYLAEP